MAKKQETQTPADAPTGDLAALADAAGNPNGPELGGEPSAEALPEAPADGAPGSAPDDSVAGVSVVQGSADNPLPAQPPGGGGADRSDADKPESFLKARVLMTGSFGRINDVVELPEAVVLEGVATGELDAHPDAVAYAERER